MGDVSQRRRTWAATLLSEHLLVMGGKGLILPCAGAGSSCGSPVSASALPRLQQHWEPAWPVLVQGGGCALGQRGGSGVRMWLSWVHLVQAPEPGFQQLSPS